MLKIEVFKYVYDEGVTKLKLVVHIIVYSKFL
jgi:hypothetical protein